MPPVPTPDGPCRIRALTGELHEFTGRLLGVGTARRETHIHAPDQPLPAGLRCSGCRWTEVRLYWSASSKCYVAGIKGHTEIPGETNRYRCWWSPSAEGALAVLLVEPPPRRASGAPGERELPVANRAALEQAAEQDPDIDRALSAWEALETEAARTGEPVIAQLNTLTA